MVNLLAPLSEPPGASAGGSSRPVSLPSLPAWVAAGLLLRLSLLFVAENRLDADESLVALMGLDVLAGREFPFFVYRTTYDGGGAFEAYLSAVGFALVGDGAWVPKLMVLGVWTASAFLFADLCRRHLAPSRARLATLLFCVGTPFFLEWSMKARGGYEETLWVGLFLLWLPGCSSLRERPRLVGGLFGAAVGVGIWLSEMLLPLLPGSILWLLAQRPREQRKRLVTGLVAGLAIGCLPLLIYNLAHDWAHLRTSVVARLLLEDGRPLGGEALHQSAAFVLGPGYALAVVAVAFAAVRLLWKPRRLGLEHIFLLTFAIYCLGYWLGGLRYLSIPPSRVLFQLHPGIAVLLAVAFDSAPTWPRPARVLALGATVLWLVSVAVPAAQWAASRAPREAGSWRGSWALIDAEALYLELEDRGVDLVFTSYWTQWPLRFEAERRLQRKPEARKLRVSDALPPRPLAEGRTVAIVLEPGTRAFGRVERSLAQGIPHRRSVWGRYVIFSGIESSSVHVGAGFPAALVRGALPLPPQRADGFN